MEMRAAEDDETDGQVAEDPGDEDRGVEQRDHHQRVVVVHLLGTEHHLQELGDLGHVLRCRHATDTVLLLRHHYHDDGQSLNIFLCFQLINFLFTDTRCVVSDCLTNRDSE